MIILLLIPRLILCTLIHKTINLVFLIRLNFVLEFNSKTLQSLRFDTLNIALSYEIRPIASGIFIIDKFGHNFTTSIFGAVVGDC
jgi:hypothetical protein